MAEQKPLALAEPRSEESRAVVPITESAAILAVIERAARDPNVNIEKMERLLNMRNQEMERLAKTAYVEALGAVQDELPPIIERGGIKDRAGNVQSKYALWEDINKIIKPLLQKHGFALSFRTGQEADKITVTGVLSHREGHSEQTTMFLPSDTSGSKNAVQAVGSSISYGKRYTAAALLNLTSVGDDDDGAAAGGNGPISEDQTETIFRLINQTKSDTALFCDHFKIKMVADLPASKYDDAIVALNTKAKKMGAPK